MITSTRNGTCCGGVFQTDVYHDTVNWHPIALVMEITRERNQRKVTARYAGEDGRGRTYCMVVAVTPERKIARVERFWK